MGAEHSCWVYRRKAFEEHLMSITESIIAKRALDNLKSRFHALLCTLRPDTKPIKNILANIPARRLRPSPFYQ
jgi:hypothetical protein